MELLPAVSVGPRPNKLAVTASVDSLDFITPIKMGDLIILKSRVTCVFKTSLEVEVEVFSEEIKSGQRKLTSHAFLTFVSLDDAGKPTEVPPLLIETPEDEELCRQAHERRADRLKRKAGPR